MQNIALEASNKSLQDFSRVVSHDLKQPLSTVIGFSRILKRREFDNLSEKGKDMLQRTINTSERMSRLIDSILGYAVLDDDTSQFGDVDLNEVFRDVIDDLEVAIRNSNANIEISPLNTVVGSSGQLYQMVQNIVNNALKYSRENVSPVITVSSKIISKGDCEITIADNGRGFDSTESERMFRPFCRLDNTDGVEGFGIGLGTVNKIVELHGGRVAAEGEPGVGATFFITLPLATPDPEQQSIH
jgi:two-component system sensor kinase FixL